MTLRLAIDTPPTGMQAGAQAVAQAGPGAGAQGGAWSGYVEVVGLVERLHRLLLDVIKDEFERLGQIEVNGVQALLLYHVGDHELSAGELRSRGYYQGSNVSYNLKKLVEMGYMHHQRSAVDRRAVRVRLTPRGKALRALVVDLFARHVATLDRRGNPGADQLAEATQTLRRLERFWTDQIRYIY